MEHLQHAAMAGVSKMGSETARSLAELLKQSSFHTGLEPLLAKAAGVLRPFTIGAGVGALGLAALAKNTAARDEKQRRNPLVYTPMSGVP